MSFNNIYITGGNGHLGKEISKQLKATSIDKEDLDITDESAVISFYKTNSPDLLIHCAAYTDVEGAEQNKDKCYKINTLGTENLIRHFNGDKFVYISTDYVFDGEKGMYKEDDTPNPVNYYALTKYFGELVVRQYSNSLIIRTTFKPDGPWKYPKAFIDQYASTDYVSTRAPQIAKVSNDPNIFGILHVAGERKSIYDLAKIKTPNVGKMSIKDIKTRVPKDVSLDTSKWKSIIIKS